MAQRNDESLSPMTRSPRSGSPVHSNANANGTANARQSGLRTELSVDELPGATRDFAPPVPAANGGTNKAGVDAMDYFHGGLPHESQSPPLMTGAGVSISNSPTRQSALKHTSGSFPQDG